MRTKMHASWLFACAGSLLIGWIAGTGGLPILRAEPAAVEAEPKPAVVEAAFPMSARLGANVYLQTSAEYRACCLQTYRLAEARLRQLAREYQAHRAHPPAVVMDLDETVFDNSAFQTFLYQNHLEYSDDLWKEYEQYPRDVRLIPGAKSFIDLAQELGVLVVYLSNRSEQNRASTIAALERLGIAVPNPERQLLLKTDTSDKTLRRAAVARVFYVMMYLGDNLRDFSEAFAAPKLPADATPEDFAKALAARAEQVDKDAAHWGHDWFILPNPVYGEWEKLMGPDPVKLFHPTTMPAPWHQRR